MDHLVIRKHKYIWNNLDMGNFFTVHFMKSYIDQVFPIKIQYLRCKIYFGSKNLKSKKECKIYCLYYDYLLKYYFGHIRLSSIKVNFTDYFCFFNKVIRKL